MRVCEHAILSPFFCFLDHRQILSHWDRLPPELRQAIQWTADRQRAQERLKLGWEKIHCQGFKDVCQFCQVPMQPRDDPARVWDYSPRKHCEECNVCFDCLIYYDNSPARDNNRCTWYAAHFRNGLRISVLDDDLSQAQLAQLEDFLDVDVSFVLS